MWRKETKHKFIKLEDFSILRKEEQEKLSDAKLKLSRWLNHHSRQFYLKEVEQLEHSIKLRIEQLTK